MAEKRKALSRADLLNARPRAPVAVDVPALGGTVWVRRLSAAERDDYEVSCLDLEGETAKPKLKNARARLVALCACEASGKPLFTADDAEQLGEQDGEVIAQIAAAAQAVNGLGKQAEDGAKKNSSPAPSSSSATSSPASSA